MRALALLVCSAVAAGCAAHATPPSPARSPMALQASVMRRAPRTAASHLDLAECAMRTGVARSLTTAAQCLSCHDGTSGPSVLDHSHPTAVAYASSVGRTSLRPVVADGIVLVNGSVECTSCHDPASTQPDHTALSLDGSTLCVGCHVR
jgi:predicted CXXCH cytochrome family protein